MEVPDNLIYTQSHEWVRLDKDLATIGITDYAQEELGDVVYVELPPAGRSVDKDEAFGGIESVKAASDLFSPLSGEVVEVNDALAGAPDLVNSSPYGDGWMVVLRLSDPTEAQKLLSPESYREHIGED